MSVEKRKWILLVSVIAVISFIFISFIGIYKSSKMLQSKQLIIRGSPGLFEPFIISRFWITIDIWLISSILLIVAAISTSYYFISKRLEEKLEANLNIISKLVKKRNSASSKNSIKTDYKNIILKFLNFGERKVVEKLIEKKGEILQSEITRLEGMTKLKTHRAVRNLEKKGIIKVEKYGKTNRIILSKDVRDIILK
jgi:DNA-binding MarR family transcriptional regulator